MTQRKTCEAATAGSIRNIERQEPRHNNHKLAHASLLSSQRRIRTFPNSNMMVRRKITHDVLGWHKIDRTALQRLFAGCYG
jgi:hypothetical protein